MKSNLKVYKDYIPQQQVNNALKVINKSKRKPFIEKGLKLNMFTKEHTPYYVNELKNA